MKKTVLFVCGGKTSEHEISLISAKCILDALDRDRFEPVLVGITKAGQWTWQDPDDFFDGEFRADQIRLKPGRSGVALVSTGSTGAELVCEGKTQAIDLAFPIVHGPFGEDGRLQGLLDMLGVPYVGSGCAASAVCMDKVLTKVVCEAQGIRTAPYVVALSEADIDRCEKGTADWELPLFVKPARLGSSVGVVRVTERGALAPAIREAFRHDSKVLVEKGIRGRELECAVLGNRQDKLEVAVPGEIIPTEKEGWYSYEAKYLEGGAKVQVPAELEPAVRTRLQDFCKKVFEVLECDGLARVDCFLDESGEPYLNEPNTLPGFTPISMYPKMWDASGLPYPQLISRLLELAESRSSGVVQ